MGIVKDRRSAIKAMLAGAGAMAIGHRNIALGQEEVVRIGCVFPLSGALAKPGNSTLTGARIAAEQINRTGGVLGRKVELVVRDDKATPAEAALVGREILGSGIKFIVGGLITAPALAIANLLAENNALMMLTSSTVMGMTHENFNAGTFRINFNARMNQYALAQAMAQANPKITKWGAIASDNQFGTENYRQFANGARQYYKAMAGHSIETLDPVLTPFPATDFKVQIARLMASPIEGLYVSLIGADFFTFMTQAKQQGLYGKVKVFVDSGQGTAAAEGLGANLPNDRLWTVSTWYPGKRDSNAISKAVVKEYAAASNGAPADSSVGFGHTAMLALLSAIRAAKSLEPPVVRVALERGEFEAVNGPFRFRREDHQSVGSAEILKFVPKAGDRGWDVGQVITIKGESVIEPPSPGQKYVIEG